MSKFRSWFLCLCLVALFPVALAAQSSDVPPELTPMTELDWGDGLERVDQVFTGLAFPLVEDMSSQNARVYMMHAGVLDHPASATALMENGGLALVKVQLHEKWPLLDRDPPRELLATYRHVVRLLSMRYGIPDASVETYRADRRLGRPAPDSSSPDTAAALEDGRAHLLHAWSHGSMVVGVEMNDGSVFTVTYERPDGYGTETILERARSEGRW